MLHISEEPHVLLHGLLRTYGDFMRWRGFQDVYVVNHPDFIRPVLTRDYRHFSKRVIDYRVLAQVMGKGLVTNDGPGWVRQRALMQPMFGKRRVNGFDSTINALTSSVMDEWEARVGGDPVRIDREMSRLTFGIVGATLFGSDLERLAAEVAEILDVANMHPLEIRGLMTLWPWVPTPHNLKWKRALRRLDRIVYGMIEARRRRGVGGDDILDYLIGALDEERGEGMDERQMRDEVVTLMLAGHETSANALAWTLYLLGKHPDVETRLHRDPGEATLDGAAATADDLPRIPYLKQVVQESMRLYPPVWAYARRAEQEEEFNGLPAARQRLRRGRTLCAAPAPGVLGRPGALRPGPVRTEPRRSTPSLLVPALCRRAAGLHRRRHGHAGNPVGAGPDPSTLQGPHRPPPSRRHHGQGHPETAPRHRGHAEPPVTSPSVIPAAGAVVRPHPLQDTVRPRVSTCTSRAPERINTRAHSLTVAPEV